MASYQIRVRGCVESADELRVSILDESEGAMGEIDALTVDHARLVARDLMTLVRQRDPAGAFVLDSHVGPRLTA